MAIERFKSPAEYTVDEHLRRHRDPTFQAETNAYRRARHDALTAAGLEDDQPAGEPKPLGEMTPQDHFDRLRGN